MFNVIERSIGFSGAIWALSEVTGLRTNENKPAWNFIYLGITAVSLIVFGCLKLKENQAKPPLEGRIVPLERVVVESTDSVS